MKKQKTLIRFLDRTFANTTWAEANTQHNHNIIFTAALLLEKWSDNDLDTWVSGKDWDINIYKLGVQPETYVEYFDYNGAVTTPMPSMPRVNLNTFSLISNNK
tara:strand:+ start:36 stop:344 length:309 start_codon:yes stop_codon:yes gene_type:complete